MRVPLRGAGRPRHPGTACNVLAITCQRSGPTRPPRAHCERRLALEIARAVSSDPGTLAPAIVLRTEEQRRRSARWTRVFVATRADAVCDYSDVAMPRVGDAVPGPASDTPAKASSVLDRRRDAPCRIWRRASMNATQTRFRPYMMQPVRERQRTLVRVSP